MDNQKAYMLKAIGLCLLLALLSVALISIVKPNVVQALTAEETQCQKDYTNNIASGGTGTIYGRARFVPNSIANISTAQYVDIKLQTFVCNASSIPKDDVKDYYGKSTVRETGITGNIDYSVSGQPVVNGYMQVDMGSFLAGQSKYKDVTVRVRGFGFNGPNLYRIDIPGYGEVIYSAPQGCNGTQICKTNVVTTTLFLSVGVAPPAVSQFCEGNAVKAQISWPRIPTPVARYQVQIDDDGYKANGYWVSAPIPYGTESIPDAPNGFVPTGGATGTLVFTPGQTYTVGILYDYPPGDYSNYGLGDTTTFVARSDCVPPIPTPPPPTITPICTSSAPSATIKWDSVSGLSPSFFTVDLDKNNNFNGSWLYKNVAIIGASPYSTAAPAGFLGFGAAPPTIPLAPNAIYQVRINYRGAAGGKDVLSQTQAFTTRGDCAPSLPPDLSCNNLNPIEVESGDPPFSMVASFNNKAGAGTLTDASLQISLNSLPAQTFSNVPYSPKPVSGGGPPAISTGVTINTPPPGNYTVTLTITGGNTPGGSFSCPRTLGVSLKPYFRAYGGDVMVGSQGFNSGAGSCTAHNSKILAFNRGSSYGWAGSGTQLAIQAMAVIDGFSSASGRTAAPLAPNGLSFTNDNADPYGGTYGDARCIPDYFAKAPGGSVLAGPRTFPDGVAVPFLPISGKQPPVYVDGDVFISNNITYNTAGGWTIGNIPSFTLVVRGNIYILANVTQLDGVYIAQPNGGGKGSIYTCIKLDVTGNPDLTSFNDLVFYNACKANRLQVNGEFIAQRINLLRLINSLRDSSVGETAPGNAAEIFQFSPELWLDPSAFPIAPSASIDYSSITSPPPAL